MYTSGKRSWNDHDWTVRPWILMISNTRIVKFDSKINCCWFHSSIDNLSDVVGFNASCLRVERRGPLEEERSMWCRLERRPRGWLSAIYNLRFGYDLLSVFTFYWEHHVAKWPKHVCGKLSCFKHRATLGVMWREFGAWRKDSMTR